MKNKKFKYIKLLYIFLIIYIGLFIVNKVGYFEYANYNKKIVTEQQIKKFEADIKNNKDIDITEYIEEPTNYQTKLSNLSLKLSQSINKVTVNLIKGSLKIINNLIE